MAYNILGITPGHNGSVALVSDGELILYLEEDRLSKIKYEGNPLRTMFYILERYKIDELVISGTSIKYTPQVQSFPTSKNVYTSLVQKYYPYSKTTLMHLDHHLTHATNAFYNSGFRQAGVLVIDNVGSYIRFELGEKDFEGHENESIFKSSYTKGFEPLYKTYFPNSNINFKNTQLQIKNTFNIVKLYEYITKQLGWSEFEAGKTMGLSSYGKPDTNIPNFFTEDRGHKDILNIDFSLYDPKDIAYKIQTESQKLVGDLVQKTIDLTGEINICISGGYGLNCVANYYMKKRFPNVNFYHEPLAHDAGNSIGAALYRWYKHSGDTTIRPRKTLYNGPKYSQEELLEGIKKYVG